MNILLVDIGASRFKSGVYDFDRRELLSVTSEPSPLPVQTDGRRFEVSPAAFREIFCRRMDAAIAGFSVKGIFLCSEMHGFIALDRHGRPCTDYVSWKDERDLVSESPVMPELLKRMSPEEFCRRTGMRLLPSLPVVNICHVLRSSGMTEVDICSLPEYLATVGGRSCGTAHITMSAGLGLFDLLEGDWSGELTSFAEEHARCKLHFNRVEKELVPAGFYRSVPIYTGAGDMQSAVLGAGNDESTVSLNLGTGSQISLIDAPIGNPVLEARPFFGGKNLSAITHIPCGRALQVFASFWNGISRRDDFWGKLGEVTLPMMQDVLPEIDLGVFSSAWNFRDGGSVRKIMEGVLTPRKFLSGLLASCAEQYCLALELFGHAADNRRIVLSGGIPMRFPVLKEYIACRTGREVTVSCFKEETLQGLAALGAEIYTGK